MGKRNSKVGVVESRPEGLLLIGASGGIGTALLDYISTRVDLICIPTYNKNKPSDSQFTWLQYDTNDFDATRRLFVDLSNDYRISTVIDVSGSFFASKLSNSSTEEISQVINTNLVAPLILAKIAQTFMPIGGKVIYMSSIVSAMQISGSSAYAASKAGLEQGIKALRSEFSRTGHAICGLRLGYMNYGMTYKIKEDIRSEILRALPEEKFIDIEVLGDKILNLIRSDAKEVNGMLYEIR